MRTASGARGALDVVARHGRELGLVILDVVMPEMSGPELARRIQALDVAAPRLFVSGFAPGSHALGDDVPEPLLQKPFTPADLLASVQRLIARASVPSARP